MQIRHFFSLIIVIGATTLWGCSQDSTVSNEDDSAAETTLAAGNFSIGEKPANIVGVTKNGDPFDLYELIDGEHYVGVIWHSPSCPCAANCLKAIEAQLQPEKYPDLKLVAVVSDAFQGFDWFEADLTSQVTSGDLPFPVVLDKDQSLKELYGAERTPTVWLMDKEGEIRFWGAPENVLEPDGDGYRFLMKEALDELKAGKDVTVDVFEPIGCLLSELET